MALRDARYVQANIILRCARPGRIQSVPTAGVLMQRTIAGVPGSGLRLQLVVTTFNTGRYKSVPYHHQMKNGYDLLFSSPDLLRRSLPVSTRMCMRPMHLRYNGNVHRTRKPRFCLDSTYLALLLIRQWLCEFIKNKAPWLQHLSPPRRCNLLFSNW